MEMVKHDLVQRKVNVRGMGDLQMLNTLEEILREEEEYGYLTMYRRDKRFCDVGGDSKHKLQMHRTIINMLHCHMRMHEKILNLLHTEILNRKTKNEVKSRRLQQGIRKYIYLSKSRRFQPYPSTNKDKTRNTVDKCVRNEKESCDEIQEKITLLLSLPSFLLIIIGYNKSIVFTRYDSPNVLHCSTGHGITTVIP